MDKALDAEWKKINRHWLNFFDKQSTIMMNKLKQYISQRYSNNPKTSPPLSKLFNPFKYTNPFSIQVVIMNQAASVDGIGYAFSSSDRSKAIINIEDEICKEYQTPHFQITDEWFEHMSKQGVFMPVIRWFNGARDEIPMCVKEFWDAVFNYLQTLGNIIWFAWGGENETYINRILNIAEDNVNKKKPDEKIRVITNVKIRDNTPSGKTFRGTGCFILANHYLKQYHRTGIKWNV